MSQLGQWLFEQQKQNILAAVDRRLPRTGVVATSTLNGITVVDPLTGDTESEVLVPLGLRPPVGARALILPLADGSRVALPLGQTPEVTRRGPLVIESDDEGALRVRTAGASTRLAVDTNDNEFQLWNGMDLRMFADGGATQTALIDAATGLISNAYFTSIYGRGIYVDIRSDGTPTTSTNASTATNVEHSSYTINLTEGTWAISLVCIANYKNNTATRGVRATASVNGTTGSSVGETNAAANEVFTLAPTAEVSGVSGTITLKCEYRAEGAGTATARDITFITLAERTA